ncbi:MAG: leucine-rich repeat domain-containing protein [Clostridia bacterium]|nr:leucine-rich repeat domain-containing protein [Clostridia bacterium]
MRCKIENGVLLVVECCEEEVVVPEGVTVIGAYAFANSAVRKVRLPLSVKKIEDKAFYCSALEEITLPRNVFWVGSRAFDCSELKVLRIDNPLVTLMPEIVDHCYNLEDVYFAGTKEQWDKAFDAEFQPYSAAFRLHLADGEVIQY